MEKPVEIKRIDLLVHPFYGPVKGKGERAIYTKEEAKKLLKIWKEHIDEAARDPNRLLLVTPTRVQTKSQALLSKELIGYAKKKMGKRIGFFCSTGSKYDYTNYKKQGFATFKDYAKTNGFKVNAKTVKTRGFGEYANSCVLEYLTELNLQVGLKDPVPYRNRQSTILARKSVGAEFKPWKLKELMKTVEGRKTLKHAGMKYGWRRRETVNSLLRGLKLEKKHQAKIRLRR